MATKFLKNIGAATVRTCLVLLIAIPFWSGTALAGNLRYSRIVVFGASLTDPGNFFALQPGFPPECGSFVPRMNWPPYALLSDNPLDYRIPDRPYLTGDRHFSNGETFVEVFGRGLGLGGSVSPAADDRIAAASNYAVAGARATEYPCRFNLSWQLERFKADFANKAPRDALYLFEIGGNDVRDALLKLPDQTAAGAVVQAALQALGQTAQALTDAGARHFLFLNVPDLGNVPAVRELDQVAPGAAAGAGALTRLYNAGLSSMVANLDRLDRVDATVIDAYTLFNRILQKPYAYGFSHIRETCITPQKPPYECRRPDDYVFWDGIHPTRAVHAIVALEVLRIVLHR